MTFDEAGKLIKYFKDNGCIVLHKCTTIRHAKVIRYSLVLHSISVINFMVRQSAQRHGVDVLSIDGFECECLG
jgi:hypothetical protein